MVKYFTRVLILLSLLAPGLIHAQPLLIYQENFTTPNMTVLKLNSGDFGTNTGPNTWVINSQYIGQPVFPNTITQDSVQGAGNITFPNTNYLHIHDQNVNTVSNANFDDTLAADRFTTFGPFCTSGDSDVHFAFFYLCVGKQDSAYGEIYYKGDAGPWTKVGLAQYVNQGKWKYEDLSVPGFENHQNLYFGVRWVNKVCKDTTTSFAIDDIKLVGTYAPSKYPVKITVPNIYNSPACLNTDITVEMKLSAQLCNIPHQGTYVLTISDSGGNFANSLDSGYYILDNSDTVNYLSFHIPSNYDTGSCFKFRITRTDVTPNIFSDTSICFRIENCPNSIYTEEPIMLTDSTDTICVNSVIDVPFYSYGVFLNGGYVAQLSDSNGNFTSPVNVLGTLYSSQTYPGPPGTVSGKIVAKNQPIPPGCNYRIRVISINPPDTGTVYPPLNKKGICIRDCNMQTNNTNDINFCIPPGDSECIPIQMNHFDDSVTYKPGNRLRIEVHSSLTYGIINAGLFGGVTVSGKDTCIEIYIPDSAAFAATGLTPGLYYIRVIADSSQTNQPWNVSGTLIRLSVGEPLSVPLSIVPFDVNTFSCLPLQITRDPVTGYPDTAICAGGTFSYGVDCNEYNPISTYQWFDGWIDQNYGFGSDFISYIFNGAGHNVFSVQETNLGCVGPGSDTVELEVYNGAPSALITGPSPVCVGDTEQYSAPLQLYCFYEWSIPSGGTITDTSNNKITVVFDSAGTDKIHLTAVGLCGTSPPGTRGVIVKARPPVNAGSDTTVCRHDSVSLSTITGAYTYVWSIGTDTIARSSNVTVTPDTTTTYIISTRLSAAPKCPSNDTVTVFVQNPVTTVLPPDSLCPLGTKTIDPGVSGATYYKWNTNDTTQTITVNDSGVYIVNLKRPDSVCNSIYIKTITLKYFDPPSVTDTTVCRGVATTLNARSFPNAAYAWNNSDTTQTIAVNDTGTYSAIISFPTTGRCTDYDTIHVTRDSIPALLGPDTTVCRGAATILDAGIPNATYKWNTMDTTQTISVHDTGTYLVTINYPIARCTDTRIIYVSKDSIAPLLGPDTSICPQSPLLIDAGVSGASYLWNINTKDTSQTITIRDPGTYIVNISYVNGRCSDTRIVTVGTAGCPLDFDNVFTPNGDNLNERWFNLKKSYFANFDVKIWDRWGLLMYESTDSQFQWDGTNKQGNKVSDGVYYWIVKASNAGDDHELHGTVTVLH